MKIIVSMLLLVSITVISSCDNQEGDADFDIISPNDSTEAMIHHQKKMPQ
jgi:hypothetical protein